MELTITRRDGSEHSVLYDAADADLVLAHQWHVLERPNGVFYAATTVRTNGRRRLPLMHALLTGTSDVDHINHNGLDNRRVNLRAATRSQQLANSRPREGSSAYKGVFWDRERSIWQAQIRINRRKKYLGRFTSEIDAAMAYDEAALATWGEYALLNFPKGR